MAWRNHRLADVVPRDGRSGAGGDGQPVVFVAQRQRWRASERKQELSVLVRPQVLSALLTTVLGAGAMFTLYTYISPVLHTITHASSLFVTAMLVLIGVGFSLGNYLGGKFADRSVSGTLKGFLLLLMVIMLAIPLLAQTQLGAAISMVVWGAATFAVVPPLQMRVMRVAHEAPGLSSSVNIGAFNLGNALGRQPVAR
jgi:DHA1 family inner membrane transport protein